MSDSFITFALKAHAALGKELAHSTTNIKQAKLNDLGLKFGASPIHKGMMLAIGYATDPSKLCSKAIEIIRCIYATYGRECIGGYANCYALCNLVRRTPTIPPTAAQSSACTS